MDDYSPEEIERARGMTGEEKLRESLQVFERSSRLIFDGLRDEFPGLPEQQLLQKLYDRLALNRKIASPTE